MSVDTPVGAPRVDWRDHTVDAWNRLIPIRVFTPMNEQAPKLPRGVLVWAHGGSWVSGSVAAWHEPCALTAGLADVTVVSVDYRLAPTHQHPAALSDVLAVLDWAETGLAAHDSGPWLAVGGDSAGGTLAASAAIARRDAGKPLSVQILGYPPLDPACDSASYRARPRAFPGRDRMLAAWRAYTGVNEPVHETGGLPATPWGVRDLAGSAPAIIAVGSDDPVHDDATRYAHRLARAGVPTTLREFRGRGHGLFLDTGPGPKGPPEFHRWIAAEVRARTHRQPASGKEQPHAHHRSTQHPVATTELTITRAPLC
jgi:acetyl esterase